MSVPVAVLDTADQVDFVFVHKGASGTASPVFGNLRSFSPLFFSRIENIYVGNRCFVGKPSGECAEHPYLVVVGYGLEVMHLHRRICEARPFAGARVEAFYGSVPTSAADHQPASTRSE